MIPTKRKVILHRSLIRPILLGGGERKFVMINFTVVATLLFGAGFNVVTIPTAFLLATIGHALLVKLAKYDEQFLYVYLRHRRYQDYYSAKPKQSSYSPHIKPSIKKGERP